MRGRAHSLVAQPPPIGGGDVASTRRQRSMKVRTARLLHRWLALLLVAASWPLLQGIKPGRHGGVVRWLLVGLIGPQALLLHRLLINC